MRALLAAALSGLLLALTLPKPGLCPLGWVAFVPLLLEARRAASARRAAWLGWAGGAVFFGVSLHWIYLTCRFAGVPVPAALLAWTALASFQALTWAVFGALVHRSRALPAWAWPLACAAAWTALEFAAARFTPRLAGDLLGYTQWRFLSWLQPSSWLGPHALGFLIVLVNAALGDWWNERRFKRPAPPAAAAAGALALLWWGAGAVSLMTARQPAGLKPKVAVLQPSIDQYRKWDENEADSIRATLDRLLETAASERPALIVWPETALPGWLEEPANYAWVASWARRSGAYHLIGTLTADRGRHYNSAVLVDPAGNAAGRYDKRELVPFGEFVPFRRWLEPYVGILAQMGDIDAGAEAQPPLETPLGPIGATSCYEAVRPRWTRSAASTGARIVVNLTNDGWYKDTWGPWQHFYTNRFRAIENRVYLVRAGNTGVSAVIDPWGRVASQLELLKEGVLVGEVPAADPFPGRSLYARTGDWLGWAAAAAVLAGLLALSPLGRALRRVAGGPVGEPVGGR